MSISLAVNLILFAINATPSPCTCSQASVTNGWCSACRVGYVAGLKIPSLLMYDALDAHGHNIDPQKMTCNSCKKALQTDGYCPACRIGFIRNQAYLSRLTYHAAKGRVVKAEHIECARCVSHVGTAGWCDECGLGIVGNVAHSDRTLYEALAEEFRKLKNAIKRLEKCESCAVASLTNGRCMTCRKVFTDGVEQPLPSRIK